MTSALVLIAGHTTIPSGRHEDTISTATLTTETANPRTTHVTQNVEAIGRHEDRPHVDYTHEKPGGGDPPHSRAARNCRPL